MGIKLGVSGYIDGLNGDADGGEGNRLNPNWFLQLILVDKKSLLYRMRVSKAGGMAYQ